jgi:hypothetical protein
MKFNCPTCQRGRHVDEDPDDPRKDHCWFCGTPVPYTDEEIAGFLEEKAGDPDLWPGLKP